MAFCGEIVVPEAISELDANHMQIANIIHIIHIIHFYLGDYDYARSRIQVSSATVDLKAAMLISTQK